MSQRFEDIWKDAFDKAEMTPSESVWTNVELELEKADSGKYKRRLLMFQLLAAASVVFALSVTSYVFLTKQPVQTPLAAATSTAPGTRGDLQQAGDDQNIQEQAEQRPVVDSNQATNSISSPLNRGPLTHGNVNQNRPVVMAMENSEVENSGIKNSETVILSRNSDATRIASKTFSNSYFSALTEELKRSAVFSHKDSLALSKTQTAIASTTQKEKDAEVQEDPVAKMMETLALEEKKYEDANKKEEEKSTLSERLWTAVGFSAGTFSAPGATVSAPATLAAFTSQDLSRNEARASGISYSVGVNVGTRLGRRWVLQGGVNYLTQTSDYTASTAIASDFSSFRPASSNEYANIRTAESGDARLVSTAPYTVDNNLRFLSIPLQAGYMVVDRKIGVQLNAGFATDVFLQNNKSAAGSNMMDISQGSGADSPYRTFNLSGLVGTEFSYRLGERYRIALNPGVRYPFSSIYKGSMGINSRPLTFDVGLRFRYFFK